MRNLEITKLVLVLLIIVFVSCEKEQSIIEYNDMEVEILQLVNQYRIINGLPMLEMHDYIYAEANTHSSYMIDEGRISHDNSEARFTRISKELNSYSFAENVASGQKTAQEVVNSWLNSDGHRKNIEGDYNYTGISAIRNAMGQYYFTQIFTKTP